MSTQQCHCHPITFMALFASSSSSPRHTSLPPSCACGARRAIARCFAAALRALRTLADSAGPRALARAARPPSLSRHAPHPPHVAPSRWPPRTAPGVEPSSDRPAFTHRRVGPRAAAAHVSSTFNTPRQDTSAVSASPARPFRQAAAAGSCCPRFFSLQRRHTLCLAPGPAPPPLPLSGFSSTPLFNPGTRRGDRRGEAGGGSRAPIDHC
jgi:hypothetical protein